MSLEGHYCGPEACPECGETHGCICGNCDMTVDTDPAADEYRETIAFLRQNADALGIRQADR